MAYPIQDKLVVAVSSSALFDLQKADEIFRDQGIERYKQYQLDHLHVILGKGKAFPFISRLLNINSFFNDKPIEVVILSRNSPESGIRTGVAIKEFNLDITRSAFTAGKNPCKYMDAYNASLFLSTNEKDVKEAINQGLAAGQILDSRVEDDASDNQLRVAFDFDSVLADDTSEREYVEAGGQLNLYFQEEEKNKNNPLPAGPLQKFFLQLASIQARERKKQMDDPGYMRIIETSIVTARNAPADERAINTLLEWNVDVDNMFLLGGIDKSRILQILKPHIYFDDQKMHLDCSLDNIPMVHIPFGIRNLT